MLPCCPPDNLIRVEFNKEPRRKHSFDRALEQSRAPENALCKRETRVKNRQFSVKIHQNRNCKILPYQEEFQNAIRFCQKKLFYHIYLLFKVILYRYSVPALSIYHKIDDGDDEYVLLNNFWVPILIGLSRQIWFNLHFWDNL